MTVEIVVREYSKWRRTHSIYSITVRRAGAPVACAGGLPPDSHPAQSHGSIRQGALLWVDQDKKRETHFSATVWSRYLWFQLDRDSFLTFSPPTIRNTYGRNYCRQVLLRRWNLLGCIHPHEAESSTFQLWQIEMPRAPISLNPSLLIGTEMSATEGKSKRIRDRLSHSPSSA